MKGWGKTRMALLLLLAGWECGWGLVCGEWAARPAQNRLPAKGELRALAVFARFQDEDAGARELPEFASWIFASQRPGSLSHFYREMSRGQLRLDGEAAPRWYTSRQPGAAYVDTGGVGNFGAFTREILAEVDAEVDLGLYDDDGPDGAPNSGDDDGYVDFLFLNTLTIPRHFIIADATGVARLGLDGDYVSKDARRNGGFIRVRADTHPRGIGGSLQRGHTFAIAVGSMAHEFGHALGLPDLYDLDYGQEDGEPDPEQDSAGVGYWCLMGHGALGWDERGGPNPFCAWSLGQLGWLGVGSEDLVVVSRDLEDVAFTPALEGGQVYKLPTADPNEYLLVEYRRSGVSYYERDLPASGLLIWRVNSMVQGNNLEQSKGVDLVCADGLFLDAGFPAGRRTAPELGGDNLDFWAHDAAYAAAHSGNLGDGTDVFDGVNFTEFSPISNPAAPPGLNVTDIRRRGETMLADLRLSDRRRAGAVRREEVWRDTVEVVGDVVVEAGGRLQIAPGAVVRFGPDHRLGGADPRRCELVVRGELLVGSYGARPALFTSAAAAPRPGDWSGIILAPEGRLSLRQTVLEYPDEGLAGTELLYPLAVEDIRILQAGQSGIRLEGVREPVLLAGVEVGQAGLDGIVVEGAAPVRVEAAYLWGNGRNGLERRGGFIDCRDSEFNDNGLQQGAGANLALGPRVFGRVAGNRLRGSVGIRCLQAEGVLIENNRLADHRIGLVCDSASPHIVRNEFIDNELALQLSGFRMPSRLELNAVLGAGQLLDNQSAIEVAAFNNWWGQDDESWISAHIKGPAKWRPFLNFDPRVPVDFALEANYPNPFNGSTVIGYTVGINKAAISLQSEMVVEVRALTGALVRRLVRQPASPGIYSVVWDGRDEQGQPVASGVYYCQLRVEPVQVTRKLMVLR